MKLLNGDCYELIKDIPDKSVDLVIIDPPYNIQTVGGGAFGAKNRPYHNQLNDFKSGIKNEILEDLVRVMKKINIYIWCNKEQLRQYIDFFTDKKCNMTLLSWHKTNPLPACANKYVSDTEYCLFFREKGVRVYGDYHSKNTYYITKVNKEDKKLYDHPTIKPLDIIRNLVINSTLRGGVVLDCFMGSGTTGVACKELDRDFIGIEIDEKYFNTAKERIENATRTSI